MLDAKSTSVLPSLLIEGLSSETINRLTDPASDPALALPGYPEDGGAKAKAKSRIASIEEIEEALNDHVRGGAAPHAMIAALFHPLVTPDVYIELAPGKGVKRPSYALNISSCGFHIERVSTRDVAKRLREMAERLVEHEVGDRAPDHARIFQIDVSQGYARSNRIAVKARDGATARMAFVAAFGKSPGSIQVPLDLTPHDILKHVVAARDVLSNTHLGAPRFRQQALDLIASVEDLRAAATVALRQDPDIGSRDQHWITITPSAEQPIKITTKDEDPSSAHERVKFTARYRVLIEAIQSVLTRHPVLRELPAGLDVEMSGEPTFLLTQIVDRTKSSTSPNRTISSSLLEYSNLNDLSARLGTLQGDQKGQKHHWRMEINSRGRSKMSWDLVGPTLSHAFAEAVKSDGDRASMVLFDLAIDIACDQDGALSEVTLYRVFN